MDKMLICRALWLSAAVFLAACGGGGGGGGFVPLPVTTTPAPTTPPATDPNAPAPVSVTLSGAVTFDSVPNNSGALVYASATRKPVRGAVVEVVNASSQAVLTSTVTNAAGAYSAAVPANTSALVRVKAQLLQTGSGATWDVTVRDNTRSDALYSMETAAFSTGAAALSRDVHAPSGWGGSSYTTTRVAAPFAVLDAIYIAQTKVLSVASATAFPVLRVFWSVNNVPASGDRAQGQIGTTSFLSSSNGTRSIFVLGRENVDTDEYDESVIAHEWGHYYQSAFSRDDSPGGSHSLSERLDRRLAFSEGWGNAWSGIALARTNYTDSVGAGQAQGGNTDLTTGPATGRGWYREGSIQAVLWNLNQQVGFKAIHDTMTGPFKTGVAVTSIHPFTAAFNVAAPSNAAALTALLSGQSISTALTDALGLQETNNGGIALALPLYTNIAVATPTSACVTNVAGTYNKLGSFVYLRLNATAARAYQISVTGPGAADPDFAVYSGRLLSRSEGVGASEVASVSLPVGESVVVINDFNDSSNSTCFTVTIN